MVYCFCYLCFSNTSSTLNQKAHFVYQLLSIHAHTTHFVWASMTALIACIHCLSFWYLNSQLVFDMYKFDPYHMQGHVLYVLLVYLDQESIFICCVCYIFMHICIIIIQNKLIFFSIDLFYCCFKYIIILFIFKSYWLYLFFICFIMCFICVKTII